LDSWCIRQSEKLANQTKKQEAESCIGKQINKAGRNEIFIPTDKGGAKKIFDLNSPEAKMNIRKTQKIVNTKGCVQEMDLPISQQEMREQLIAARRK